MIVKVHENMSEILKIIEKKNGKKLYYSASLLDSKPFFKKIKNPGIYSNLKTYTLEKLEKFINDHLMISSDKNMIQMKLNRDYSLKEINEGIKKKKLLCEKLINEYREHLNKNDTWVYPHDKKIKISNFPREHTAKLIDFVIENKSKRNFFSKEISQTSNGEEIKYKETQYYMLFESGEIIDEKEKKRMEYHKLNIYGKAKKFGEEGDNDLENIFLNQIKESDLGFQTYPISKNVVKDIIELEKFGIEKKLEVKNQLKNDIEFEIK
jgi:hypothetical protein